MSSDVVKERIAYQFNDPETALSWASPLRHPDGFEEIVGAPERYDTPGPDYDIAVYGCGDGTLLFGHDGQSGIANRYDADITAYDYSTTHAEQYAKEHGVTITFIEGNMLTPDGIPSQEQVGWGYANNVLQDLENPQNAVDTVYDNIRDDGYLFATIPGDTFYSSLFNNNLPAHPETGFPHFSGESPLPDDDSIISQYIIPQDDAKTMFRNTGFDIINASELPLRPSDVKQFAHHVNGAGEYGDMADVTVNTYVLQK